MYFCNLSLQRAKNKMHHIYVRICMDYNFTIKKTFPERILNKIDEFAFVTCLHLSVQSEMYICEYILRYTDCHTHVGCFLPPLPEISSHPWLTKTVTSLEIATDVYKQPHCQTRVVGGGKFSSRSVRVDVSTLAVKMHFPNVLNSPFLLIYYVLWSPHVISL